MHHSAFGNIMLSEGVLSSADYDERVQLMKSDIIVVGDDRLRPTHCVAGSVCSMMQVSFCSFL